MSKQNPRNLNPVFASAPVFKAVTEITLVLKEAPDVTYNAAIWSSAAYLPELNKVQVVQQLSKNTEIILHNICLKHGLTFINSVAKGIKRDVPEAPITVIEQFGAMMEGC